MHRSFFRVVVFALMAAGLGACGSTSKTSAPVAKAGSVPTTSIASASTTSGEVSSGPAITISSALKFSTSPVRAGSRVTVRNDSTAQHTVSADTTAGGFDVTVDAGKTVTFTAPSKRGAYGFHCNIHNFMKATLTVT